MAHCHAGVVRSLFSDHRRARVGDDVIGAREEEGEQQPDQQYQEYDNDDQQNGHNGNPSTVCGVKLQFIIAIVPDFSKRNGPEIIRAAQKRFALLVPKVGLEPT